MKMSLAEAIVIQDQCSRLGYPNRHDRELLGIARATIETACMDVRLRFVDFKNTPSEGPSKTKLPASPDAGGGPIPQPSN